MREFFDIVRTWQFVWLENGVMFKKLLKLEIH